MTAYDVIVLGLGGMGSAAAYQIAARGLRVLGLEQFTPAHNRGSSHGQSRIIREAYFEHPAYVPLVQRAYQLWRDLEQRTGSDLLRITGGLMIGRRDSELVTGALHSAQVHQLPHTLLDADELRRRYPLFQPDDADVAVYEPRAGHLDPEACVSAHISAALQHGAELHFEEPVLRWEATDGGVTVETAQGRYQGGALVITAGPWAGSVVPELDSQLQVERIPVFWFRPAEIAPFAPERFPIYIWEQPNGRAFYGFPRIGDTVKVAQHYGDQFVTPDTIDRVVHPNEVEAMRAVLAQHLPTLDGELVATSTCMYTNSPDLHFIIDRHPQHSQVAVAAGFSGHGFKFSCVVGELLADLALDPAAAPIELFRWSRLQPTPERS
jgi:sarcosine oxidase